ncbi:MAG: hypothetical protein KBD83_08355 [Gammaproteobacteria bacterium]|nr:hypothetical protein [Gammaproteobacteria bacterium]
MQIISYKNLQKWKYDFYPLVWKEIPNFDLLRALQHGLIPSHYLAEAAYIDEYLQAYIDLYLTDEIRKENDMKLRIGAQNQV